MNLPQHCKRRVTTNNAKQNRIDYVKFPAPSAASLSASKKFYGEVFGGSFQDWGEDYADTKDSGVGSGIASDPLHRPATPLCVSYWRTSLNGICGSAELMRQFGALVSCRWFLYSGPRMKTVTLTAHFDGEHIQLDERFELPSDARLLVTIVPQSSDDSERKPW